MPTRARVHNPFSAVVREHQVQDRSRREHKRQAERLNPHQRGYTREWRKVSRAFLKANPLCSGFDSRCEAQGKAVPSREVDHVIPHRGNLRLFWDQDNWQALCHACHSSKTAREDGGFGRPVIHRGPPVPGTMEHRMRVLMGNPVHPEIPHPSDKRTPVQRAAQRMQDIRDAGRKRPGDGKVLRG